MATWRTYATGVSVTAGILIGTAVTYNKYVTGQAAAEAAGAAWERNVVATLTGNQSPALWYTDTYGPPELITNYVIEVSLSYVSGTVKCNIDPVTLTFSTLDWSTPKPIELTRKNPYVPGSGATYSVNYGGAAEGTLLIDAQAFGSGPGWTYGVFTGEHVSVTPAEMGVGDDEPLYAYAVLLAPPTSGIMTVTTNPVLSGVTGMAAISPFIRSDQIRYFMDKLRESVQSSESEGGAGVLSGSAGPWWLGPGEDIGSLAGESGFAEYITPALTITSNRWEDISENYLYPTGGFLWARSDGPVTSAPPKFFTLNSFYFSTASPDPEETNAATALVYLGDRFGWDSGSSTNASGIVTFMPSAVFPYDSLFPEQGLDTSADFAYIDLTNSFPYMEKGSWWVTSGIHTNVLWQFLSNEWINATGDVKRSPWVSSGDIAKCRAMAAAMSNSVAICPLMSDATTAVRTVQRDMRPEYDNATNTVVNPTLRFFSVVASAHVADELYTSTVDYEKYTAEQFAWHPELELPSWVQTNDAVVVASIFTNRHSDVSRSALARRFTDVYLDYPSEYAITNGYVSRVRVFLLYEAEREYPAPYATDVPGMGYTESWRNTTIDPYPIFYGDETTPTEGLSPPDGSWRDVTQIDTLINTGETGNWDTLPDNTDYFGLGVFPQLYNSLPNFGFDPEVRTNDVINTFSSETPGLSKVRITLAATFNSPTEYPIRISFGSDAAELPELADADYYGEVSISSSRTFINVIPTTLSDEGFAQRKTGTQIFAEKYQRWLLNRELTVKPFAVVVVDWNFKHMNPANPYTPTAYTPVWLR